MDRRRRWIGTAGLALCLATTTLPGSATAAPRVRPAVAPAVAEQPTLSCGVPGNRDEPSDSSASFTGPSDANDVAIGVPGAARGSKADAGLVEVRFACAAVQGSQELQLPSGHRGDRFGAALTTAHLDADVYTDLVVGIPGLDVGGKKDAGGIALFRGSPTGLVYVQTLTQATPGVPGAAQAGAHFGAVLTFAAERWWDDEPDGLLGVGAPDKDVSGVADAGAVVIMRTLDSAEPPVSLERTLADPGVPGKPGKGDHLGAAIDLDSGAFAIGIPGRRVHGHARAGAVLADSHDPDTSSYELFTQDTPGFADTAERGDRFGSALAGGWIGVPGEDLGTTKDTGLLQSLEVGDVITQDSTGFPGGSRAGDRLGTSIGVWKPPGLNSADEHRVLAGMPGKDVAGVKDAGALLVFRDLGSNSPRISSASTTTMPDPERGAAFGTAATRAGNQVVVGAPGAGSGRGRANVFDSSDDSVPLASRGPWTQVDGAARGNAFGSALGGIPDLG